MISWISRRLFPAILGYAVCLFMFLSLEYSFYRFSPITLWSEYYSIEPIKPVFKMGEPVYFYSVRVLRRDSKLKFIDTQLCDLAQDGDEHYFNQYMSEAYIKTHDRKRRVWKYDNDPPLPDLRCRLKSQISVELPYGIIKRQVLFSGYYEVSVY